MLALHRTAPLPTAESRATLAAPRRSREDPARGAGVLINLGDGRTYYAYGRGVYWSRVLSHGRPVCFSVTSVGDVLAHEELADDVRAGDLEAMLVAHLNAIDPLPVLPPLRRL